MRSAPPWLLLPMKALHGSIGLLRICVCADGGMELSDSGRNRFVNFVVGMLPQNSDTSLLGFFQNAPRFYDGVV